MDYDDYGRFMLVQSLSQMVGFLRHSSCKRTFFLSRILFVQLRICFADFGGGPFVEDQMSVTPA